MLSFAVTMPGSEITDPSSATRSYSRPSKRLFNIMSFPLSAGSVSGSRIPDYIIRWVVLESQRSAVRGGCTDGKGNKRGENSTGRQKSLSRGRSSFACFLMRGEIVCSNYLRRIMRRICDQTVSGILEISKFHKRFVNVPGTFSDCAAVQCGFCRLCHVHFPPGV